MLDRSLYDLNPARVMADIAIAYAIIAAGLAAAAVWPHPIIWTIAFAAIGTQQYALQIILHDGLHGRIWPNRRTNDLFSRILLSYWLFSPFAALKRKHLAHHAHLGTPLDPDRYYHVTFGKHTRGRFLMFATAVGAAMATVVRANSGGRRSEPKRSGIERENLVDWFMVLAVQVILAVGLALVMPWYTYLVLWVAPFFVCVFLLQNLRSFAEHAQPEPDDIADTHREITYRSFWIERLFLAPKNMNYHAEHHFYPAVPYYHLPALRKDLEAQGAMQKVEYRRSYTGFLIRFFLALPIAVEYGPSAGKSELDRTVSSAS